MRIKWLSAVIVLAVAPGLVAAQDRTHDLHDGELVALVEFGPDLELHEKGYLGIELLTQSREGRSTVIVSAVNQGTGAFAAGIEPHDQLLVVNGRRIAEYSDLTEALDVTEPGQTIDVLVLRDGIENAFEVLLGRRASNDILFRKKLRQVREGKWFSLLQSHGIDMGVHTQDLSDQLASYFGVAGGVLVTEVVREGVAESAGLRAGDIIIGWEGEKVSNERDLARFKHDVEPGVEVQLSVQRRDGVSKLFFVAPERDEDVDFRLNFSDHLLHKLTQLELREVSSAGNPTETGSWELIHDWKEQPNPDTLRAELAKLEFRAQQLRDKLTEIDD